MPTLARFLKFVFSLGALFLAATLALAYLVPPNTRPMSEPIDSRVLGASPPPAAAAADNRSGAAP